LKIRHHTLVATTPAKVQWRAPISHLALIILTVIKYQDVAVKQPTTASLNNNDVKSVS
jgi:hypothetical protein